jgi:prepilin-type N-terminal cleavage/methylation domain-containing protein
MNQKGFTLVELAIVLVIIGVILGGVIKGQELVVNARIKGLYREYQRVEFAYFAYIDRFNAKPGDDNRAAGAVAASTSTSINDGVIDGAWNSTTVTDENVVFWAHLRNEGFFVDGVTPITTIPTNVFGSNINVTTTAAAGAVFNFGAGNDLVCFSAIDGDNAAAMDAQFDDGDATAGLIQGGVAIGTALAYVAGTPSIVCIDMD